MALSIQVKVVLDHHRSGTEGHSGGCEIDRDVPIGPEEANRAVGLDLRQSLEGRIEVRFSCYHGIT